MEKESRYKSKEQSNVEQLLKMYRSLERFWKEEIKTDELTFNYDSQDIYKSSLEEIFMKMNGDFDCDEDEKPILHILIWQIRNVISLYEKNKSFFDSLNREWLVMRSFRKNYARLEIPDDSLRTIYEGYRELSTKSEYYSTNFFNDIGFLEINFHREIYFASKILLKYFKEGSTGYVLPKNDLLYANNQPLFPMKLIGDLHPLINDNVIEAISDFDFFREINYMHSFTKTKVKKGQWNLFYYIIHKLDETISDSKSKELWLKNIFKDFDIKENTYNSKYRYVVSRNASEKYEDIVEEINRVFRAFEP